MEKQWLLINSDSKIPSNLSHKADKSLSDITCSDKDIQRFIKNFNPNKAYRQDMISLRMLQIWSTSLYRLLEIVRKVCLETEYFPSEWKKTNVIYVHWKIDKSYLKIITQYYFCRPEERHSVYIAQCICFSEKIIYFTQSIWFWDWRLGCINQLYSITYELCKSIDDCDKVRAIFLDMPKSFSKVWYLGLYYKLNKKPRGR